MRRAILAGVAAVLLGGCALPLDVAPVDRAGTALDRAGLALGRIERAAELLMPLLPAERQVRVRAVLASLAIALDGARGAQAADDRTIALGRVQRLTRTLSALLR